MNVPDLRYFRNSFKIYIFRQKLHVDNYVEIDMVLSYFFSSDNTPYVVWMTIRISCHREYIYIYIYICICIYTYIYIYIYKYI